MIVPAAVAGAASTRVQAIYQGRRSNRITRPVQPSAPGVFPVVNQDGSRNSPDQPAARGSVVMLFGAGAGLTSPWPGDGAINSGLGSMALRAHLALANQPAAIEYAGPAPGLVAGVFQINFRVPDNVPPPRIYITLTMGEANAPSFIALEVK